MQKITNMIENLI